MYLHCLSSPIAAKEEKKLRKEKRKREKTRRKKENAVLYFMEKREKYEQEIKMIANKSPFSFSFINKKPRTYDCMTCAFETCTCCSLFYCQGCFIHMLLSDQPSFITGCFEGCLLNLCLGGRLRTNLLRIAGADRNNETENCLLHIFCLPCAAGQEMAIVNYYWRKRYGYKEEESAKLQRKRRKQLLKSDPHQREIVDTMQYSREKENIRGLPPYPMLTEWHDPQRALQHRMKKFPQAPEVTMN